MPNQKVFLDMIVGTTALGRIEIELFYDITPKTAENFRGLCTGEYGVGKFSKKKLTYKGSRVHRIVENQYIQAGDIVYGNGKGGESIYGEYFKDENFKRRHACAGLLSMANTGRNMNSSQFIITLKPCPFLDGKNVVFGQVINGMEIVREIGKVPTDVHERPKVKVLIFDCGDYDVRNIHLREDVFKETIQSILEDRAQREKVKLLGPEEVEAYRKRKIKSAFDVEQEYSADEQDNEHNKNAITNEDNESDDVSSSSSSSSSSECNENDVNNIRNDEKFKMIRSKIIEAKNLNNKAVVEENAQLLGKRTDEGSHSVSKREWFQNRNALKNKLKLYGVPENKMYTLDSINVAEMNKMKLHQKEKNERFGWDVFNADAYYRAHKKRLRNMPFDKALYKQQMQMNNTPPIESEARKTLLQNDINLLNQKRAHFSRRRTFVEDQNVDYINERNRMFNKKLERFFGKDTLEIKANLERGTAI